MPKPTDADYLIPVTPIMTCYRALRASNQEERLAMATRFRTDPSELAELFAESVRQFWDYDQSDHPFYPHRKKSHIASQKVKATKDIVLPLQGARRITPTDAKGRLRTHEADARITPVPAEALAFQYVDRELLLQRTRSPAKWSDGHKNGGGLRLDILLADAKTKTPVAAELKLPGDMDPFFALVQALACAAHLATRNQQRRMCDTLPDGNLLTNSDPPATDVFVLYVKPPGHKDKPPRGKFMPQLHAAVENLAPRLLALDELASSVRRIAGIEIKRRGKSISAEVGWAWERPPRRRSSGKETGRAPR